MEAEYSTFLTVNGAFVFNVDALLTFVRVASSYTEGDITITVALADDHTISGTNLHQLMSDIYVKSREIESVTFDGMFPRTVVLFA